ncbi:MAG: carbohydrate ABC transporter permease [Defluviitaleaceae bacterium]|nr:carbohydrate ABC transporter permease [Defluviitaleaceae bacterium]
MDFKHPKTVGNVIFSAFNYLVLITITVLCVYPFYYVFINSISANELSAGGQIMFFPREVHFTNYIQVMRLPGLARAAFVSVSRTVLGTIFPVLTAAFMGYLFTKNMWGRKFWYRFVIASMYLSAGLIPYFMVMIRLGFMNNFWVYIVPSMVQPFSILLVKTFIESTPPSLQESAEIDGAGPIRIFFFIVMPLIKPILATIAIFAAVGQWNAFMDTVIFVTDSDLWTLQYVLHRYLNAAGALAQLLRGAAAAGVNVDVGAIMAANPQTPTSVRMTITMVVTLPILFVYPFFQKYFVKGMMIGAVKG